MQTTQGRFILLLELLIAAVMLIYFWLLRGMDLTKVIIILLFSLIGIAGSGQISIERVAGPVGEALIMTAAGLAVAIPAVLAYNWFGRVIGRIEAELEGFARDLREMLK